VGHFTGCGGDQQWLIPGMEEDCNHGVQTVASMMTLVCRSWSFLGLAECVSPCLLEL